MRNHKLPPNDGRHIAAAQRVNRHGAPKSASKRQTAIAAAIVAGSLVAVGALAPAFGDPDDATATIIGQLTDEELAYILDNIEAGDAPEGEQIAEAPAVAPPASAPEAPAAPEPEAPAAPEAPEAPTAPPGESVADIRDGADADAASIGGRVVTTDAVESNVAPGAPGILLTLHIDEAGEPGDAVAEATTDADGNFLFVDLDPGDYLVVVNHELPGPGYFLQGDTASDLVEVDEGEDVGGVDIVAPTLHRERIARSTPLLPFSANPVHGMAVDLDPGSIVCNDATENCEIVWYAHVHNHGQTPLTLTDLYSAVSDEVTNVRAYGMGRVPWGMVAAGFTHSLGLDLEGRLWAWGSANNGRLGDGTSTGASGNTHARAPQRVIGPAGSGTWANCRDYGIGCLEDVAYIAAGGTSVAMTHAGAVYAWGLGSNGRIGDGATSDRNRPTRVTTTMPGNANLGSAASGANSRIVAMSAGDTHATLAGFSHALAVDSIGNVWGWGHGNVGQMGRDGTTASNPRAQRAFRGQQPTTESNGNYLGNIADVSAGFQISMALDNNGYVWTWGDHSHGRTFTGGTAAQNTQRRTPGRVLSGAQGPHTFLDNIVGISAGSEHAMAVCSQGFVWTWGSNTRGILGDGTTTSRTLPVRVYVAPGQPLTNIIQVEAGQQHSMALDSTGRIWAWGTAGLGRLGNGNTATNQHRPVHVNQTLMGLDIVDIGAGANHSLSATRDGYVFAWGRGDLGQMGEGPPGTADRANPVMTRPYVSDWTRLLPTATNSVAAGPGSAAHTVSQYPLAATIAPGTTRTTRIIGNVQQVPGPGRVAVHQAWARNHNNHIPVPDPALTPAIPVDPYGIPGNPTCSADATGALTQHGRRPRPEFPRDDSRPGAWPAGTWDSPIPAQWLYNDEDQCDQVPVMVPGLAFPEGTVAGVVWYDMGAGANARDGIRQPGEAMIGGVRVEARRGGVLLGYAMSAANGTFSIPGIPYGPVDVHFTLTQVAGPRSRVFTTPSTVNHYVTRYDSDVNSLGVVTGVIVVPEGTAWVDAGKVSYAASIQATLASPVGNDQWLNPATATNPVPVTLTIRNNGDEPLTNIDWTFTTPVGPAIVWSACTPTLPLAPNAEFTCNGTLTLAATDIEHRTNVTVTADGASTGDTVSDTSTWGTVWDSFVRIQMPESGGIGAQQFLLTSLAAILAASLALKKHRRTA